MIERGCKRQVRFRNVKQVRVSIHSEQTSRGASAHESKVRFGCAWFKNIPCSSLLFVLKITENPPNRLSATPNVINDYFSCEFLLAFPITGSHVVHVSLELVDDEQLEWHADVSAQIQVRTGSNKFNLFPFQAFHLLFFLAQVKSYDEAVSRQQQQQYAAQRHAQRTAALSAKAAS